jgi:hypothetical protein
MIKVHRKLALFTTTMAFAAIPGLAFAGGPKKPHPSHHGSPSTTAPTPPSPTPCVAHSEGYTATGTLIAAGTSLTAQGHGRYSGTIEVNVTKANHHGTTGDQTFTLTNARVKFHHGVSATTLADGDRVKLHGKVTALPKHCSTTGFTPTITVKKVDVHQPKKAKH